MKTKETIKALLDADESISQNVKMTILELLDRGIQSRCVYLTATDAANYCGVSRSTFLRHIAPTLKPIRWGSRTVRYSIHELDKIQ